jgi:hypothetical protein
MSSDFCHVTFPPPSPSTPESASVEEDADLAKLIEDFMGATRLQISLRQRIESFLEKKAKEAQAQEEKARLAWAISQAKTRAIQESTYRLREKMKLAEHAGHIGSPITVTRSVQTSPAEPTFPGTPTLPVDAGLPGSSVIPVKSPSPIAISTPPELVTGVHRSPRMSSALGLVEPVYIETSPPPIRHPMAVSMALWGDSPVRKPSIFETPRGLLSAQSIAPEPADVRIR